MELVTIECRLNVNFFGTQNILVLITQHDGGGTGSLVELISKFGTSWIASESLFSTHLGAD